MRCKVLMGLVIWVAAGMVVDGQAKAQKAAGVASSGAKLAPGGAMFAPLGPMIEASSIKASSADAKVLARGDTFRLDFPADAADGRHPGRPQALFLFPTRDLTPRLGMAVDIKNLGSQALRVYGQINQSMWSRDYVLVPAGGKRTLYIFVHRVSFSPAYATAAFPGMLGIPGGEMKLWAGAEIDASAVTTVSIFLVAPRRAAEIEVSHVQPFGLALPPSEDELAGSFFPFIDRFGQMKHKEWPGKVQSEDELKAAAGREAADLAKHASGADRDQYGGWAAGPKLKATGHFRTEKVEGKWWLVDPDGHLFWSHGVDVVVPNEPTLITGRERFFEDAAPGGDFLARNLQLKYGDDWRTVWTTLMTKRLPSWGYNTVGSFSGTTVPSTHKMPYTAIFSSTRGMPAGTRVTSMTAEQRMANLRTQMEAVAAEMNDDPWCIGFYVDNEIHENSADWWNTYYSGVSALAKELLPNKLYLGSRLDFHDWPNASPERQEIVRIASKYTDVISFNQYRYTFEDFTLPADIDKPVIIGEFHFGALDRGPLHTGLRSVVDQNQRADAYTHYVETALENPNIVGAHWFQLYDEPTTGRGDGEDYQIGLLDICDQPYAETIEATRHVGSELYRLRMKGR